METITQAEKARIEKHVKEIVAAKDRQVTKLLNTSLDRDAEIYGKKFLVEAKKLKSAENQADKKLHEFEEKFSISISQDFNTKEITVSAKTKSVYPITTGYASKIYDMPPAAAISSSSKILLKRLEQLPKQHNLFIENLIFQEMPEILKAIHKLEAL